MRRYGEEILGPSGIDASGPAPAGRLRAATQDIEQQKNGQRYTEEPEYNPAHLALTVIIGEWFKNLHVLAPSRCAKQLIKEIASCKPILGNPAT
jgi:hypothetical protein